MRALVIDRSALRRALVRRTLASNGSDWIVEEMPDTGSLGRIEGSPPHVIATPEPGAPELRDFLRGREIDIPVVALTNGENEVEAAFHHGAFDCVTDLAGAGHDRTNAWRLAQAFRTAAWCNALERACDEDARASARAASMQRFRVLQVDDSPGALAFTRHALKGSGFELVQCALGHEAIQLEREAPFDAALLDSQLPDADGAELARDLVARSPSLAVVGLSSTLTWGAARSFLASGAAAYLVKGEEALQRLPPALRRAVRITRMWQSVFAHTQNKPRLDLTRTPSSPWLC